MIAFAAIDFETADRGRDSACAVGAVLVRQGRIAGRYRQLIRPPRSSFEFTHIHGLTWADVRDSPAFGDMWPDLRRFVDDAGFLVAHNAGFDRSVLEACCAAANVAPPELAFHCTVQMARRTWKLPSASLPAVCRHLGIPLDHHDALSDAEACARGSPSKSWVRRRAWGPDRHDNTRPVGHAFHERRSEAREHGTGVGRSFRIQAS